MTNAKAEKIPGIFRSDMALWIGVATTMVFFFIGKDWLMDLSNPLEFTCLFLWLFTVMLWLSFRVVRHAGYLGVILGELYGTLILTLAIMGIEVIVISTVMTTGVNIPILARDTMFLLLWFQQF